jgi:hypothetical protein
VSIVARIAEAISEARRRDMKDPSCVYIPCELAGPLKEELEAVTNMYKSIGDDRLGTVRECTILGVKPCITFGLEVFAK